MSAAPAVAPQATEVQAPGSPLPESAEDWLALVSACGLKGPAYQLASHCAFLGAGGGLLRLHLPDEDAHLRSDGLVRQLTQALNTTLGASLQLRFEAASASGETLHKRSERQRSERQISAEQDFRADPVVSQLLGQGGSIVPDSIRPLDSN